VEPYIKSNCQAILEFGDIARLGAFLAFDNVKLDALPFGQGFESVTPDCREVHKNVRTVILLDEAKPLGIVKPLDCTFCHFLFSLLGPLRGVVVVQFSCLPLKKPLSPNGLCGLLAD